MPPRKKTVDKEQQVDVTETTKTRKRKQKEVVDEIVEQTIEETNAVEKQQVVEKETIAHNTPNVFPGQRINYNNMQFVVLSVDSNGVLVISSEIIDNRVRFSDNADRGSNDWRKSAVRKKLNTEFIKNFNQDDLIPIVSDLTADTGEDNYGVCEDLIALPSDAVFRRFNKLIPNYNTWVWSITPWAIDYSAMSAVSARTQNKTIYSEQPNKELGVAIICKFNFNAIDKLIIS